MAWGFRVEAMTPPALRRSALLRAGVACARPLAVGGSRAGSTPTPRSVLHIRLPSLPLPLYPLSGVGWDSHVLALARMVPVSPPEGCGLGFRPQRQGGVGGGDGRLVWLEGLENQALPCCLPNMSLSVCLWVVRAAVCACVHSGVCGHLHGCPCFAHPVLLRPGNP